MDKPNTVSREEWIKARKELMDKEKELTRHRDQVSEARRALPWVVVTEDYVFQTTGGEKTLADLFDGKSQLIVQHFMFGPNWEEGCPSCSFLADGYDGINAHLNARDTNLVAVSIGPVDKLQQYKKRMGWSFNWYSSTGTSFNHDYNVSFALDDIEAGNAQYNYQKLERQMEELPGTSIFYKDEKGVIYHTFSVYSRGLDPLSTVYQFLDLTPKGRDEKYLPHPMSWIRRHDVYED